MDIKVKKKELSLRDKLVCVCMLCVSVCMLCVSVCMCEGFLCS